MCVRVYVCVCVRACARVCVLLTCSRSRKKSPGRSLSLSSASSCIRHSSLHCSSDSFSYRASSSLLGHKNRDMREIHRNDKRQSAQKKRNKGGMRSASVSLHKISQKIFCILHHVFVMRTWTTQYTEKRVLFYLQLSLEQGLAPPLLPGLKQGTATTLLFSPCRPESCHSADSAAHFSVHLRYHSKISWQGALWSTKHKHPVQLIYFRSD